MLRNAEVMAQINGLKVDVLGVEIHPLYGVHGAEVLFRKGKAKTKAMQTEVEERLQREVLPRGISMSERGARHILNRAPTIAFDCSGFVFQAARGVSLAQNTGDLADYITVPLDEVYFAAEKWAGEDPQNDIYSLNEADWEALASIGPAVPLPWFCKRFGKEPESQTNISRLASPTASVSVEDFDDIAPGDLFLFTLGQQPWHVGIVGERNGGEIQIWDCGASNRKEVDRLGGVGPHDVTLAQLRGPFDKLPWSTQLSDQFDGFRVRRPMPFVKR